MYNDDGTLVKHDHKPIVMDETGYKEKRILRNRELIRLVQDKQASDPDFAWSWIYVGDIVRVTVYPRP